MPGSELLLLLLFNGGMWPGPACMPACLPALPGCTRGPHVACTCPHRHLCSHSASPHPQPTPSHHPLPADDAHSDIPVPDHTFACYPEARYTNSSWPAIQKLLQAKSDMVAWGERHPELFHRSNWAVGPRRGLMPRLQTYANGSGGWAGGCQWVGASGWVPVGGCQ